MKKTIIFSMVLFMFAACYATDKENPAEKATETQSSTIYLTKADFLKKVCDYEKNPNEWKYLGDKPCLIDFYASWCGPCKMIAPFLEALAKTYAGKIYVYKIDIDKERELAVAFNISSIPVLLFVPLKNTPQMAKGAMPKDVIEQAIKDILLK
jgi:thioredoxin